MRRWGDRRTYLDLISRLRDRLPGLALRTIGHRWIPGRNRSRFEDLASFVREIDFDFTGVFEFSPKKGPKRRPSQSGRSRCHSRSEARAFSFDRRYYGAKSAAKIGAIAEVLVEALEDGITKGRGNWQAPEVDGNVYIDGQAEVGDIIEVTIARNRWLRLPGRTHCRDWPIR